MNDEIITAQKEVIKKYFLENWFDFDKCPKMKGYIGNTGSSLIWFLCERPSIYQYLKSKPEENKEWDVTPGDKLFREAIELAGLGNKNGSDFLCYISNLIMEPKKVKNWKKDKKQVDMWIPFLQEQIEKRTPKVIVTVGKKATEIFEYMLPNSITPHEVICQYTYITNKPEKGGKKRPPNDCDRKSEFINSICRIADKYS